MKVCVPQWPNGATAINLVPRKLRPCNRTILVFTEVWSTKTRRWGWKLAGISFWPSITP